MEPRESDPILKNDAANYFIDPAGKDRRLLESINLALYLRKPLYLFGYAGGGKSRLISRVAHELQLGPVLRWNVDSRSTVRSGLYEYDAVGHFQSSSPTADQFVTLGQLGTALAANGRPRALLIDEVDKADVDFLDDLLNVIDSGSFPIPELCRSGAKECKVRDCLNLAVASVPVHNGWIQGGEYPFVVMTANSSIELTSAFRRRVVVHEMEKPDPDQMAKIVLFQLQRLPEWNSTCNSEASEFLRTLQRSFDDSEVNVEKLANAFWIIWRMANQQIPVGAELSSEMREVVAAIQSGVAE